ncbi:succinate dehydrogenase hydrophobic membrane anchor subunit [soil metagenome]|jgi:succinate dehydrogenase / fumarate reductase membrane anchor subunit|nr:succinate dehydrogenase hydrophobic membrane anchor subunit [Actinomycetota bacterium]MDQ3217997.1 succinate dehydrogenase hydrophobic membrane anchor subunit [Actinomycetota bacterium]
MATVEDIYRKHKPKAFSPGRRPSSTEVWWWFFMRISGVILLFLVLIHLYVMHLVGSGVERVGFDFVAERWANVGWRAFDWVLLVLALLHGVNGLRIIIDDYIRSPGARTAVKGTLYGLTAILMIMGTTVVVAFDAGVSG